MILIANAASLISSKFRLYPGVSRTDGLFDVLVFTADTWTEIVSSAARFATVSLDRSPHVLRLSGQHIRIEAEPALPTEIDGDLAGLTPLEVKVEPSALNLVCGPKDATTRLKTCYSW